MFSLGFKLMLFQVFLFPLLSCMIITQLDLSISWTPNHFVLVWFMECSVKSKEFEKQMIKNWGFVRGTFRF